MNVVVALSLIATVSLVLVAQATLGTALPLLLDQEFAGAIPQARLALLASIPYVLYMILRGPIDALELWPHNTINLCLTLGLIVLLLFADPDRISPALALLIGLSFLGIASLLSWSRCIRRLRQQSTTSEPADDPESDQGRGTADEAPEIVQSGAPEPSA